MRANRPRSGRKLNSKKLERECSLDANGRQHLDSTGVGVLTGTVQDLAHNSSTLSRQSSSRFHPPFGRCAHKAEHVAEGCERAFDEIWTRLNSLKLYRSHGEEARALTQRVALIELAAPVLERALEPFSIPVRTLDALHLASIAFLLGRGQRVELASYDDRLLAAAKTLGVPIAAL